ncbi:oxygen-dependent tRNA uridine(34) hydroxylase TrhO [Kocuria sp. SL71]|uniref:oxygen-dependent tRNA uridine(34) hydroxylase TrhO n=1 Tax=Kocuria sp. SL71 TaxID=2995151 RepID=UPI0022769A18|nr:rhodanese-related sulfurtransferase [Kocuria sp. SL71]MCY1684364.1 rhodanese-related sulfurtransferase [Kocuria sp. SL71]
MTVERILLHYRIVALPDPQAIALWQEALCERWGLRGRIIVSPQGLNGTVGGEVGALKQYAKATRRHPGFRDLELKWSDGSASDFPRLSVKVRRELVGFGAPDEVAVDEQGVVDGGVRVSPQQLDDMAAQREDLVLFDGRNAWEARIGRFQGAVVPDVETSRDFAAELDSGAYDHLKDRPVVTYCTGGIRCEFLSAMMRRRGFREVYQLDGGIVRYGEARGDAGLWQGSLAVFDDRGALEFSEDAAVIGQCDLCGADARRFENCARSRCHRRLLMCEDHRAAHRDGPGLRCPDGYRDARTGAPLPPEAHSGQSSSTPAAAPETGDARPTDPSTSTQEGA